MATRGCVAIGNERRWRGVYNHSDSYPTYLGREVWHKVREMGVEAFCRELLKFTDWREFLNAGVCPYCGRRGVGQPHSIRGDVWLALYTLQHGGSIDDIEEEWIRENVRRTGFVDPDCKCHEHTLDDGSRPEDHHITSKCPDPLYIEWVYIINPERRTMIILHSAGYGQDGPVKDVEEPVGDGWWDYGHCCYTHVKVAEVPLDGPEPDWEALEELGHRLAAEYALGVNRDILMERFGWIEEAVAEMGMELVELEVWHSGLEVEVKVSDGYYVKFYIYPRGKHEGRYEVQVMAGTKGTSFCGLGVEFIRVGYEREELGRLLELARAGVYARDMLKKLFTDPIGLSLMDKEDVMRLAEVAKIGPFVVEMLFKFMEIAKR